MASTSARSFELLIEFGLEARVPEFDAGAERGHLFDELDVRGQELVKGRIDQADCDRLAIHRLEDAFKVGLLDLLELVEA